jgi:Protein of unknown function (DUF2934)
MNSPDNPNPSHEKITARAKEFWENDGRPEGRELEHWLKAEAELGRVLIPAGADSPSDDAKGTAAAIRLKPAIESVPAPQRESPSFTKQ